ncbi:glycoside hydrolase family 26 protein [Streptacidiphilus jiangxiensis]|uniref:Glycosyl hydrolase family 26 n=1 Tax=Streptacidiphilus jiangxiensis TaxID=235985 RepID=A0A1H7V1M8_STRJI|nr:glycosyl hydrolase [Streptacidiphilus jiangxiensis]SEM02939.1 Glycosyl hydrolase family 26 [Streptacidiphilus jiangxiensis]
MTPRHTTVRIRSAAVAVLCLVLVLAGCGSSRHDSSGGQADAGAASAAAAAPSTPYDVTPLIKPSRKYLGVALATVPKSMTEYDAYSRAIGKRPDLVEYYASFGDGFDAQGVRRIYDDGGLPYMAWEPFEPSLASIASGASDAYVTSFARSVRALNLPLAISFGHEMNGNWYAWGMTKATPEDFVKAWRHIHDLFEQAGATNVIWAWSPNVINPVPSIALKPYYPGDAYVDWVGMIGYYTVTGQNTFDQLFGPTMRQVRQFTRRPFVIAETASQLGPRRQTDVDDLFDGVAAHADVVGFIWFNVPKRADWRIQSTPHALAEYRKRAAADLFGFDVRKP